MITIKELKTRFRETYARRQGWSNYHTFYADCLLTGTEWEEDELVDITVKDFVEIIRPMALARYTEVREFDIKNKKLEDFLMMDGNAWLLDNLAHWEQIAVSIMENIIRRPK